MEAFQISTPSGTWFLQKSAGGFSSALDTQGRDWINFNNIGNDQYPASAAGRYRGLPNMVHGTDDAGVSHPGFEKCRSTLIAPNRILVESLSGLWRWQYIFTNSHAEMKILASDPAHKYWFLYEGTPGGRFEPSEQYWGNSNEGPLQTAPGFIEGTGVYGKRWQWAYFGDNKTDNIFFVAQGKNDSFDDQFSYMGNDLEKGVESEEGMVVFGFGRTDKPLMTGYNRFYFGFIDMKVDKQRDHQRVSSIVGSVLR